MPGIFYLMMALWLALALAVTYLYWQVRHTTRNSLTDMYLDQLQQQISALQRDMVRLHAQAQTQANDLSPYKQAIEMIQQGICTADVAARCGISRGEVELIVSLYRPASLG